MSSTLEARPFHLIVDYLLESLAHPEQGPERTEKRLSKYRMAPGTVGEDWGSPKSSKAELALDFRRLPETGQRFSWNSTTPSQ